MVLRYSESAVITSQISTKDASGVLCILTGEQQDICFKSQNFNYLTLHLHLSRFHLHRSRMPKDIVRRDEKGAIFLDDYKT